MKARRSRSRNSSCRNEAGLGPVLNRRDKIELFAASGGVPGAVFSFRAPLKIGFRRLFASEHNPTGKVFGGCLPVATLKSSCIGLLAHTLKIHPVEFLEIPLRMSSMPGKMHVISSCRGKESVSSVCVTETCTANLTTLKKVRLPTCFSPFDRGFRFVSSRKAWYSKNEEGKRFSSPA